jgi:hypothetical protein
MHTGPPLLSGHGTYWVNEAIAERIRRTGDERFPLVGRMTNAGGLVDARYAPIATKFRSAAK